MNKTIVLVGLALAIAGAFVAWTGGSITGFFSADKTAGALDGFAQCLSEKGVTMYGAYWCPHCQNQKQMFGESFSYVNYVECALPDGGQAQACEAKGISGYPTWDINGELIPGEMPLKALSAKTGCPLD